MTLDRWTIGLKFALGSIARVGQLDINVVKSVAILADILTTQEGEALNEVTLFPGRIGSLRRTKPMRFSRSK